MKLNRSNRTLFHGDNLEFMRAMNSETVDLIATDPPFNKGRDFQTTSDSHATCAKFQDRQSWQNLRGAVVQIGHVILQDCSHGDSASLTYRRTVVLETPNICAS